MKIEVNHEACIGCGMCNYIDNKTFDFDDQGYITTKSEEVTDLTKEAANNCPVNAIKIIEPKENDE